MSTPAGWYDDGSGSHRRFWDGTVWTDQRRLATKEERRSVFDASKAAKRAEKQRQIDELDAKYGKLLSRGALNKIVEIRGAGYVRIWEHAMSAGSAQWLELQGINFGRTVQDKSLGGRAVGVALTGGLNLLASNQKRDIYLTIIAGGRTFRLKAQGGMAERAAAALEAAGQAVLSSQPQVVTISNSPPLSAPSSVADELLKLAQLRDAGVLTEAEFAAQKATLLGL